MAPRRGSQHEGRRHLGALDADPRVRWCRSRLSGFLNRRTNQIGNWHRCHFALHGANFPMVIVRVQLCGQVVQILHAVRPQTGDKTIEQRDQRYQRNQVGPEQP